MTRTNTPDEDAEAINRQLDQNDEPRIRRHKAEADSSTRLAMPKERLGASLAADDRPADESETADALKRAAENDGRV